MRLFLQIVAGVLLLCSLSSAIAAETTSTTQQVKKPAAFPLSVKATLHGELKPGVVVPITLRITYADGIPVLPSHFVVTHTKLMHLLVIDPSLQDYQHIHPTPAANGEWNFTFTPRKAGSYRIWVDATLKRGGHQYLKVDIGPPSPERSLNSKSDSLQQSSGFAQAGTPLKTTLAVDHTTNDVTEVNGYRFTLSFDSLPEAGKTAMGIIKIRDHDGHPFTGLEPVMGAFAHIVGFSEDGNSVLHVHPVGEEPGRDSDRGGPELQFHLEPAKPGFVKLFVQTKIKGQDVFVPFGVMVK